MSERVPCVVPGCGRTNKPGLHDEWICGEHWRLVDRRLKMRRQRVRHQLLRRGEIKREDGTWWVVSERARRLCGRLWAQMKAQAIQGQAGI